MTKQTIGIGATPAIEVERVGSDLFVRGWELTDLEAIGSSLQIERNGNTINISSSGELQISVPYASSVFVRFVGGDVNVENLGGSLDISFVGGDAILSNLTSEVSLSGFVEGNTQLENVRKVSIDSQKKGTGNRSTERRTEKTDQVIRRTEQKLREAQIKMQSTVGKAEHRAQIRIGKNTGRWKRNTTPGVIPATKGVLPISNEERMTILKMLQEKKITSDQADKLLAALEGFTN